MMSDCGDMVTCSFGNWLTAAMLVMRTAINTVRGLLIAQVIKESGAALGGLKAGDVVVASDNCLGHGSRQDLTDVVYLRPHAFDRGLTRMMASELDAVVGADRVVEVSLP